MILSFPLKSFFNRLINAKTGNSKAKSEKIITNKSPKDSKNSIVSCDTIRIQYALI